MSIITVSREFGSGGREVGKRLADALGYRYFDKEILNELGINYSDNEYLVDLKKRIVISTKAFEKDGKTYYTLSQIKNQKK